MASTSCATSVHLLKLFIIFHKSHILPKLYTTEAIKSLLLTASVEMLLSTFREKKANLQSVYSIKYRVPSADTV